MGKFQELEKITREIRSCRECPENKFGLPVVGEGNPNSEVILIGEAPGREESKVGRPFVGRSGRFLDKLLSSISVNRGDVYVTSPVKYYPGRRILTEKEILHGRLHLIKQIEVIDPKVIVSMGKVALFAIFEADMELGSIHGDALKWGRRTILPTFHPAAAMRFPKIGELTRNDFQKLKIMMNKR